MIINVGNDQSLGDLQQKIGERSGTYYIIFSYVLAVIFGIISISLVYLFFKNKSSNDLCPNYTCVNSYEQCYIEDNKEDNKCKSNYRYNLFIAGSFMLFSIIVIILCRYYNKFVHSSRQNAQIGAGVTEAVVLESMLKNR